MSKTKTSGTTHYEILFIIPNRFTDDEAKKLADQIKKILTDNQATISFSEYWGKKRLAYEIKHNAFGYYGLFEFDLEGAYLAKINKELRLFPDVLRHQIVVKKVKTEQKLARDKKIRAKIESKKAIIEKELEEKEKASSSSSAVKKKTDKRVDLKDLDEKLEGILNTQNLI